MGFFVPASEVAVSEPVFPADRLLLSGFCVGCVEACVPPLSSSVCGVSIGIATSFAVALVVGRG